jgi:hypothetical protein
MCWISVKNQPPEIRTILDIWIVSSNFRLGFRVPDVYLKDGEWWCTSFPAKRVVDVLGEFEATHWRYPPAPPAEFANAAKA